MALSSMDKLNSIRVLMKEHKIDAYVVPSEDAHASEYLAPCDNRRAYLTGFTGSAGCAVITFDQAWCWTDGRYWLQAEKQLGEGWRLKKSGLPGTPTWSQWLVQSLSSTARIGIDPTLIPYSEAESLMTSLSIDNSSSLRENTQDAGEVIGDRLVSTPNLVDKVWETDTCFPRPAYSSKPIFQLSESFAGEALSSKLARIRDRLKKIGSPGIVVSTLDEAAWVFNLRGSDIPYNPVFFAYALITTEECTLFLNLSSLSDGIRTYLHSNGVAVLNYDRIWTSLQHWQANLVLMGQGKKHRRKEKEHEDVRQKEGRTDTVKATAATDEDKEEKLEKTNKVLIGTKTSWAVVRCLGPKNVLVRRSFIEDFKARKNVVELEGFRRCHIRDGVAVIRYLAWLEQVLKNDEEWSEYDAAQVLEKFRKQGEYFMGLSFETISSTGPNGAIIHYAAPAQGSSIIRQDQMYLCDSGAQYLDGTTDVTRTVHFGQPTLEQKRAFTRVLQGHIGIDTIIFPRGTTGYVLDVLARRPLWSDGLDYRHSTSHGVGSFLNVHEGPQGVGQRPAFNQVALEEGMVISNEPGYYKDGEWGIRIEGLDIIERRETRENFGNKGWLGFERITMVPIQTSLIEVSLLSAEERAWINGYHEDIYSKVFPELKKIGDFCAIAWLDAACKII
ncbi:uncharacterized protein L203_102556 [Cryptococcus depauperatus CBS 7841]|uniref:Xaa-Pro aminopeptidase n=1 Tax=Cryptococcus depauperatus CBS 7841 TaxID=1295531 RepID=A0AAJ8JRZ9_9TREE